MARKQRGSPLLHVVIDEEQYKTAERSNSGGCLIADAIRAQYPALSGVQVDMATIRATDRERGVRFTYLTPPAGQHLLLSFDQGWPNPTHEITLRRAVKIEPVIRSRPHTAARAQKRAELEAKESAGDALTPHERSVLSHIRNVPDRPHKRGPAEVEQTSTVRGGHPLPQGPAHPNLLRGRNRHFGAKLADPGLAFNEAVEAAVAQRLEAHGATGNPVHYSDAEIADGKTSD